MRNRSKAWGGAVYERLDLLIAAAGLALVWFVGLHLAPWSNTGITDVPIYQHYAQLMHGGELPYRDFALEYPPLAAPIFWVAGVFGTDWPTYSATFGGLMFIAALCCLALVDRLACALEMTARQRRLALLLFAISPLLVGSAVRTHFDFVPVALVLAALLAIVRRRPVLGLGLLGIGAMVKLFPLLLLPGLAAYLWGRGAKRAAWRGAFACAAIVAVASVACLALSAHGYLDSYKFQFERPVQIESTPASLLLGLDAVGADRVTVTGTTANPDRYKSQGLESSAATPIAALLAALAVVLLAASVLAAYRCGRRGFGGLYPVVVAFGVTVTAIAFGKVLSPQYMIWLLPFAALLAVRDLPGAAIAVGIASVLTLIEFPGLYNDVIALQTGPLLIVAARNLALLAALGFVISFLWRRLRVASIGEST